MEKVFAAAVRRARVCAVREKDSRERLSTCACARASACRANRIKACIRRRIFSCIDRPSCDGAVKFAHYPGVQSRPLPFFEFDRPDNDLPCLLHCVLPRDQSLPILRESAGDRPCVPVRSCATEDSSRLGHQRIASSFRQIGALMLMCFSAGAGAQLIAATDELRFSYAPSAFHRSASADHVKYNNLFSIELLTERWRILGADRTTIGAAFFNNSFGQPCQYVFGGPEWDLMPLKSGWLFANVTAGALHGYSGEYQNKIPFNRYGTAPAAIPSIGWRYSQASIVMSLLGNSGVLISFSWSLGL